MIKYNQLCNHFLKRRMVIAFFMVVFILISCSSDINRREIPIIYVSDLYHPFEDPDDHFDLAALFGLNQFEIKAVIIDNAKSYKKTPGRIPVEQMNYITDRNVPVYVGLKDQLESMYDTGENQPVNQEGCQAILKYLETSVKKVTIVSVGSLRDIAAAYNRNSVLFKEKVDKLIIFIGEANNKENIEYNVSLDKNAYISVMNRVPNVWWVPCFDGGVWKNNGNASFWQGHHSELLEGASDPVLNYFIYALTKSSDSVNYIQYLDLPVNIENLQSLILDPTVPLRNLWCCSVFSYFAEQDKSSFPFTFEQVNVSVDSNAVVHYTDTGNKVMRFSILDKASYSKKMTKIFNDIIRSLLSHD